VKTLGWAKYVYTKSNLEWSNHPAEWRRKSQLADGIISISEATSQLLKEHGFGDRTEKIYLGIDTDTFSVSLEKRNAVRQQLDIPENALVYGCVGQFIEVKDHVTLIDAFERVADRYPGAHLVICGPHHNDAYYHGCLARIKESRHASAIRVLGRVRDMQGLYSALDVFVLPSKFEAFGYAYVEAMSCERPTIGCRSAGPLEIIDEGRTGYFCAVSNPVDLAYRMSSYAADRALIPVHGEAARTRARALFSKDVMARQSAELYLRLLRYR
jgi:glycosyltransferase involved in cell wall biosynthesis